MFKFLKQNRETNLNGIRDQSKPDVSAVASASRTGNSDSSSSDEVNYSAGSDSVLIADLTCTDDEWSDTVDKSWTSDSVFLEDEGVFGEENN